MNDIADCYRCRKNTSLLPEYFNGSLIPYGLNADLIAVSTHGIQIGSGSDLYGMFTGYDEDDFVYTYDMEPEDGEIEIYVLSICDIYTRYNYSTWHAFRNLHRRGALVGVGCWDSCSIWKQWGNTTFNIVGNEIADFEHDIWDAWKEAHDNLFTPSDDIITYGLGRVGAENCDNRARNVSFQNRLEYHQYSFGHNEPWHNGDPNKKELCGYYLTNY
jgi:hypothetical protein